MKISKLTEYELLGSIEDLKGIHRANQSCEKILETSLMVSQNNRLLNHELEVYKRALELALISRKEMLEKQNCFTCSVEKAKIEFLDQARKELEDERN